MSEEQISEIVDRVIEKRHNAEVSNQRWRTGLLITVAMFLAGLLITGTVRLIQNDTIQKSHMADGHPETVKQLIKERDKELVDQRIILTEIQANQVHLMSDMVDLKKGLLSN